MKLSKKQFKEYILQEVKKLALKEGILLKENNVDVVNEPAKDIINNEAKKEEVASLKPKTISEEFETVIPVPDDNQTEPKFDVKDVKKLNEEFKRMKQLIDFRNPLLNKD